MTKTLLLSLVIAALIGGKAQAADQPSFQIGGMTGNYYLDRDSQGVSTLSAEEVITVAFPTSGASFSNFDRVLPGEYLKQNNSLKVDSVTDVGGQPVHYQVTTDQTKNLVINIGDPAIKLYGNQTYIIRYESKGVINFLNDRQQFYPNFNGRGWNTAFPSLNGIVHLSKSIKSQLLASPQCLIDSGHCDVKKQVKSNETVYYFSALGRLPAHQSLTAKIDFKPGTFQPYKAPKKALRYGLYVVGGLIALAAVSKLAAAAKHAMLKQRRRDKK